MSRFQGNRANLLQIKGVFRLKLKTKLKYLPNKEIFQNHRSDYCKKRTVYFFQLRPSSSRSLSARFYSYGMVCVCSSLPAVVVQSPRFQGASPRFRPLLRLVAASEKAVKRTYIPPRDPKCAHTSCILTSIQLGHEGI